MAPLLQLVLAATLASCSALQLATPPPMAMQAIPASARALAPTMLFERKEKTKTDVADGSVEQMVEDIDKKEKSDEKTMLQQVKDAGVAGAISYAAWELAFWGISVPVCIFTYVEVRRPLLDHFSRLPMSSACPVAGSPTLAEPSVHRSQVTGHLPDFSNQDDLAKLGAEAFAFVNLARFAVPLRIGLALSTTPWVQANVVDRFMNKQDAQQ